MQQVQEINYLAAAAALFDAFTFERLVPLAMLFSMSCLFIWVLFKSQKRADFDASMFLRNDRGILATDRLLSILCFMVHTWYIATRTLSDKVTDLDINAYSALWSASAVAFHWLDTWRGVRTNTPLPDNPMRPPTVHAPPVPTPAPIPTTAIGAENDNLDLPKD